MDDIIQVRPDKERAKSLMEMTDVRFDSIKLMENAGIKKFASKIIEEYYETIIELITAIMSLDGYKTRSDAAGAHMISINYMRRYKELKDHELLLMNDLRKKRNGIKYYGRHVSDEYLRNKKSDILNIINKLTAIAKSKL